MNTTKAGKRKVDPERNEIITDRYQLLIECTSLTQSAVIETLAQEYELCYSSIYYIVKNKQPKRYYIKKSK